MAWSTLVDPSPSVLTNPIPFPSGRGIVYVITDRRAAGERSLIDIVHAALRGGANAIQLRDKDVPARAMIALGEALLPLTRAAGVPLIVNDRVDVALALDADGVHVGQDDIPADMVRRIIGPARILGVSVATVEQAQQAARDGATYVSVGDLFGTPSKPDAGPPIGLTPLTEIARAVDLPVLGIGGITVANAASVVRAGAVGVAVISAVIGAPDPEAATRALCDVAAQR
ncbi:thiamine phosphate synthase [Roseiflexus castenholzii]|jgi:thiamine-phosphate pyrophosphorylase|uniref:Thiamine-phosphate synthase n=1 Tax=Roseiflexus castenholzii (strain DSM 13941 / HLO8) TaxID=383372 RepID=THIE_ROSCS|nr:thiamine phosphate synthase [Roseiflexus castenholzii]A7NRF7.1 RecName: Full=Thiamine-phosphate synthase; Short=TP synthase; Short=TPS; AltName: Full=Thiamine-phosphate pyrophosphorylase; Short=TMP pyrophosphorylase; Short=TMP-PPase [Roseiflexus castenholzii DSM 13941]ABU60153.1 thiamine-phosphate pyrophosphorylase [Roseiflexus castenholzii DSM 13941]